MPQLIVVLTLKACCLPCFAVTTRGTARTVRLPWPRGCLFIMKWHVEMLSTGVVYVYDNVAMCLHTRKKFGKSGWSLLGLWPDFLNSKFWPAERILNTICKRKRHEGRVNQRRRNNEGQNDEHIRVASKHMPISLLVYIF